MTNSSTIATAFAAVERRTVVRAFSAQRRERSQELQALAGALLGAS